MSALSVRRPLALLAVLGMVATLLFAVVGTAGAADPVKPNSLALFSACPDNADIPDPGFSDIPSGSYLSDSVDCLAYYAVTVGTTPDTYSPGAPVTRLQMAVFLYRMAPSAGVEFNGTVTAPFNDIGGASQEAQDAINHLASIDVVHGTTDETFSPDNPVTRQQMAQFLARYSDAPDDGHGAPDHGPGGFYAAQTNPDTSETNFTDIAGATGDAVEAITAVFHLGVAAGTTATTYDPTGVVTRGQMSLFITRLMGQMNTRPAGVNIQANPMTVEGDIQPANGDPLSVKYSVTVRDTDFTPDNDTRVDAFKFYADNATDTPFNTDGTCDTTTPDAVLIDPGGSLVCRLTTNDPSPSMWAGNSDGNFGVDNTGIVDAETAFTTLYAWTGPLESAFYSGTTYSSVVITGEKAAPTWDYVALETDTETGVVPLGTTVTWTAQLMDSDHKPFAEADVEVEFRDLWGTSDVSDTTTTVKTDASGKATYARTETVASHSSVTADAGKGACCPVSMTWTDAASAATRVVVTTPVEYQVLATAPTTTPPVTVTATVYDQYGDVFTGAGSIQFERTFVNEGAPIGLVNGVATRDYPAPTGTAIDLISAKLASPFVLSSPVAFYWVDEADKTVSTAFTDVFVADMAKKSVVLKVGGEYLLFTWDSGDQFKAIDDHLDTPLPTDMDGFEEQLVKQNAAGAAQEYQEMQIPFYDPAGMSDFSVRPR